MNVRIVVGGAAGAAVLATLITTGTASAGAASITATSLPPASIRAAHLSPDMPGADVYLTSSAGTTKLWMSDEKYGQVSSYVAVTPGVYTVSLRLHGAPESKPALMSWRLAAATGKAYTAAAVGTGSSRKGAILFDDLSTPRPGTGRVRVIQAASAAPRATVIAVHGPVVAQNTSFASSTGYAQVPAGTWPLQATAVGAPGLSARASVSVASASVTSVLLLDRPGGGLALRSVIDAAGAPMAPAGAVPAGGGSTATSVVDVRHAVPGGQWLATLAVLLVMLGAGWTLRSARRAS